MNTSQIDLKISHDAEDISHGEPEPTPDPDPDPGAPFMRPLRGGILHSKRDVEQIMARLQQVVGAFRARGVPVAIDMLDLNTLRPRGQAYAACRLLVLKGICTQEEVQFEEAAVMLEMLGMLYQAFEERQAQANRPQVQAVRGPKLILPGQQ